MGCAAQAAAVRLLGDAIYANPMLLGVAWQKGFIPVGRAALERAMELNGVAVAQNKAAFAWGRRAAADPMGFALLLAQAQGASPKPSAEETLAEIVACHREWLGAFQSGRYARRYERLVDEVRRAEEKLGSDRFSRAVARYLGKLMAYKDEYEVARLHAMAASKQHIQEQFTGTFACTITWRRRCWRGATPLACPPSAASGHGWGGCLLCCSMARCCAARHSIPLAIPPSGAWNAG